MRRHPRLVGHLWRWHRRVGLLTALFALVLASTGILLNHSARLGLDRHFVDWRWLRLAYGEQALDLPAYRVGQHWISRSADGRVFLDAREVAPCRGDLVGALWAEDLIHVGCAEELLLITDSGELVESITPALGLPAPLAGLGLVDSRPVLRVGDEWRLADLEGMTFSVTAPVGSIIQQLAPGELPDGIRAAIPDREAWLSWERLLLDLHSGRIMGRAGVMLADIAGLLLCTLGLSGVAMWWLHHRGGRRP